MVRDVHGSESRDVSVQIMELARNASIGVCLSDANGKDVMINDRWCTLTGVSAQDAKEMGWLRTIHPEDKDRVGRGIERSRAEGTRYSMEHRILRSDGSILWVLLKSCPLADSLGRKTGTIAAMLEVAAPADVEQNLVRATLQAGDLIRIKLSAMSGFKGDPGNPRKETAGFSALVRDEIDQTRNAMYMQMIHESSRRLSEALDRILLISRNEGTPGTDGSLLP